MSIYSSLKSITLVITLVLFVSCGSQKPMVDDIKVSSSSTGGDIIVALSANLSIGNVQLPNASFPIILPKIGKEIGMVSLVSASSGQNLLQMEINVSEAANLELASVRLPNGSLIPLIADNAVLRIPLGKVEVLLSLADGSQALGVIIPIKSFDAIGAKTGTAALIPAFSKNGIMGAAGVYTSKTAGKNGFVLVADISGKMGGISIPNANMIQMEQAPLDYSSQVPSSRVEKKINKGLLKLHSRRTKLRLR